MALAAAAEACVGSPFRLHGRDPARGLDCVGLLAAALTAIRRPVQLPQGYRLHNANVVRFLPEPADCGFTLVHGAVKPGDVLLLQVSPVQHHIAIASRCESFVHAHAGLRRVVIQSGPLAGRLLQTWRLLPPA